MSSNYLILNGDVLIDGGVPSVVVSGSAPTAGMVIAATGSATAQWSDVGAGTITLSGNVTGAANANTVVAITPAAAAGTTGGSLAITPQPGTASGGNVIGGNCIISLQVPTGAGNLATESHLIVNRGSTTSAAMGPWPSFGSTGGALWLEPGGALSFTNHSLVCNSGITALNSPNTEIEFSIASSVVAAMSSTSLFPAADITMTLGQSAYRFTSIGLQQGIVGGTNSGTTGTNMTITPEVGTSSSGNVGGGSAIVALQAPTGTGSEAALQVKRGGSLYYSLQALAGAPTTYAALYMGAGVAPSSSNYALLADGTANTELNCPTSGSVSITVGQVASIICEGGSIVMASPLVGYNGTPLQLAATSGAISTANNITLSTSQKTTPVIQLDGTVNASGISITLPNTVGGVWLFDITGVTFGHTITWTTGSGTTAALTAAQGAALQTAGTNLITVCVVASNFVSLG